MSTRSILPSSKVRAAVKTVAPWQGGMPVPSRGVIKLLPMEQNQTDMFNFASLVLKEICNPELPPFPLPTSSISKNQSDLENHMLKRVPEWRGGGKGGSRAAGRPGTPTLDCYVRKETDFYHFLVTAFWCLFVTAV